MAKKPKPFERATQEIASAPKSDCKHPPDRLYAWHVDDPYDPTGAIFCVCCCACGGVLAGAAEPVEKAK